MTVPFIQRLLTASFELGTGTFGEGKGNTVKVEGLRMRAEIERAGGFAMGNIKLDIWGMDLNTMNHLTTTGQIPLTWRRNNVQVNAGDISGMTQVFGGQIISAYADLSNQPDVHLHVEAAAGYLYQVQNGNPTSYKGTVSVEQVMKDLAGQMNMPFNNYGVTAQLDNPYFSGALLEQAQECVNHAKCVWNKGEDGTIAIWPTDKFRTNKGAIPLVAPETGLVSYPEYSSTGIRLRTLFNPAIQYGAKINVQSDNLLKLDEKNQGVQVSGSGEWIVYGLNYSLETLTPNGAWFADIDASPPGVGLFPSGS